MKMLFIIKERDGLGSLLKMYERSQVFVSNEVVFLLIHDAVLTGPDLTRDLKIFACDDDVKARNVDTLYETLDYPQILRLISDSGKVICW